jgi:hypothetical protein
MLKKCAMAMPSWDGNGATRAKSRLAAYRTHLFVRKEGSHPHRRGFGAL